MSLCRVHHVTVQRRDSQTGRGGAGPRILAADPRRAPSCSLPALLGPLPTTCLSPTPRLSSRLHGPKPDVLTLPHPGPLP